MNPTSIRNRENEGTDSFVSPGGAGGVGHFDKNWEPLLQS